MTPEQERLIRDHANRNFASPIVDLLHLETRALAQVVLDLAAKADNPLFSVTPVATDWTPAFGTVFAAATASDVAVTHSGVVDLSTRIGPITAEELRLRGVSEEVEGRALDVVLRCGWPRHDDPLGMKPCIPVPVETLERLRSLVGDNNQDECDFLVGQLLAEQERIVAVYVASIDKDLLPERST